MGLVIDLFESLLSFMAPTTSLYMAVTLMYNLVHFII